MTAFSWGVFVGGVVVGCVVTVALLAVGVLIGGETNHLRPERPQDDSGGGGTDAGR